MKRDLKSLFAIAGKKMAHPRHELVKDFENVSEICSKHHVNLSSHSLKKLWELATGKRKLSKEAKDRLALFAGFQSWDDLDDALHGDVDASINYTDRPRQQRQFIRIASIDTTRLALTRARLLPHLS